MLKDTIRNFFKKNDYKDPMSGYVAPSSVKSGAEKPKTFQKKIYEIPCAYCHEGMPISNGQIVNTHKACRALYRRSMRMKHA